MLLQKYQCQFHFGLDSHLETNSIHWDCTIKHDSNWKKYKNDTCSWCECMQHRDGIALYSKEFYIWLLTKRKDEAIAKLTIKSNTPEWFCMRSFSFTSTTVHVACTTLIMMNINDLEELGFNEVNLHLLFDHIRVLIKLMFSNGTMMMTSIMLIICNTRTLILASKGKDFLWCYEKIFKQ